MSKATDISKINEHSPYYDMTPGNQIYGGGGSRKFCTGEWRTKCCGICERVCSFGAITMKEGI